MMHFSLLTQKNLYNFSVYILDIHCATRLSAQSWLMELKKLWFLQQKPGLLMPSKEFEPVIITLCVCEVMHFPRMALSLHAGFEG